MQLLSAGAKGHSIRLPGAAQEQKTSASVRPSQVVHLVLDSDAQVLLPQRTLEKALGFSTSNLTVQP